MDDVIEIKNGYWTLNGKKLEELNPHEIGVMMKFFTDIKERTEESKN